MSSFKIISESNKYFFINPHDYEKRLKLFQEIDLLHETQYQIKSNVSQSNIKLFFKSAKSESSPEISMANAFDLYRLSEEFKYEKLSIYITEFIDQQPIDKFTTNFTDENDQLILDELIAFKFENILMTNPTIFNRYSDKEFLQFLKNKNIHVKPENSEHFYKYILTNRIFPGSNSTTNFDTIIKSNANINTNAIPILQFIDCSQLSDNSIYQIIYLSEKYKIFVPNLSQTLENRIQDQNAEILHKIQEDRSKIKSIQSQIDEQKAVMNEKFMNDLKNVTSQLKKIVNPEMEPIQQKLRSLPIRDENQEEIDAIKVNLKCLKYEVKKLKESNFISELEKMQIAIEKANSAEQKVELMKEELKSLKKFNENPLSEPLENEKIKSELKCIKYEVKKLKNAANQDKIFERSANMNLSFDQEEKTDEENDKIKKDLRTIKYHVKKLKDKSNEDQETFNQIIRQIKILAKQQQESQMIGAIQTENAQQQLEIRCLKYEVKKLKEQPIVQARSVNNKSGNEAQDEISNLQDENIKFRQEIESIKNEIKKLKELPVAQTLSINNAQLNSQALNEARAQISNLQAEDNKLKHEIGCLKYEVKKLKEKPIVQTRSINSPSRNEAQDQISNLQNENSKFREDLGCLKYEVKKLKANAASSNQSRSAINDHSNIEERLKKAERNSREAKEVTLQYQDENDKVQKDLRTIKYHVKKLKDQSSEDQEAFNQVVKKIKAFVETRSETQISDQTLSEKMNQIGADIRCMKYELKKLKMHSSSTTATTAPVFQERNINVGSEFDETNDKIQRDFQIIKSQIKKLQDQTRDMNETKQDSIIIEQKTIERPTIPDSLFERILSIENKVKIVAKYASDSQEEAKSLHEENNSMRKDLRCVKYELKKLKEGSNASTSSNNAVFIEQKTIERQTLPNEIYARLSSAENKVKETKEQADSIFNDNLQMKNEIRCLKYEVKKLKESPAQIVNRGIEAPIVHDGLLERLEAAERNASEAKSRSNEAESSANEARETANILRQESERMKNDLGCIKYEVKKLKSRPVQEAANTAPVQERAIGAPANSDDLLSRLEAAEKSAQEANSRVSNVEEQTSALLVEKEKLEKDLGCIKYEVKKLKSRLVQEAANTAPVQERAIEAPTVSDDLLSRLEAAEKSAQEANSRVSNVEEQTSALLVEKEKLKNDLGCVKYEVKKLKSRPVQEAAKSAPVQERAIEAPAVSDDLLSRLEVAEQNSQEANSRISDIEEQASALKTELRCVKYEVKKLKERPAPSALPVGERSAEAQALPEDLLERLSANEENANEANSRASKANLRIDEVLEESDKLKTELRCIKYEVKKLKERPNSAENGNENEYLKASIKCLKYEVKKLKESQTAAQIAERGVESSTLPSDLLDRLSSAEKKAESAKKEMNSLHQENMNMKNTIGLLKYEVSKLKENPASEEQVRGLIEKNFENGDLKASIKCLKYEVKKLKESQTSMPIAERGVESSTLPSDLLGRLSAAERKAESATNETSALREENDILKHSIGCMKYEIKKLKKIPIPKSNKSGMEVIYQECMQLRNSVGCLKYEMKKLKENQRAAPSTAPVAERGVAAPAIPSDLIDRLSEAEKKTESLKKETSSLRQENKKLNHSVGCLKYEVKKLKEDQAIVPVTLPMTEGENEAPELSSELLNRLYSAEKKAESAKNQTSSLRQENKQLKHSIGCLKYEVKKMKENQASSPAEERSVGDSSIPEDLVERLTAAERKAADAQNKANETKSIISEVQEATTSLRDENEALKHSIGCLKYEVKKLKEHQTVSPAPSSAPIREREIEMPSIPSDLLDRLSAAETKAESAKKETSSLRQENKKLNHSINCMKYEVKKLKEQQAIVPVTLPMKEGEHEAPTLSSELLNRLYSAEKKAESAKNQTSSLRQENKQLKHSIGCLKYEMKKMKENQASSPAEERSVGDSSIPEDLVERLAAAERKAADAQNKANETKSIISEVQEATTSLRDENETLKHSIGCLKYEMKKLKEHQRVPTPAPSAAPIRERGVESPSIPSDLLDRLSAAETKAESAKKETSSLRQENKKLNHSVGCLKYEVKKLKEQQAIVPVTLPIAESENEAPTLSSELLNRLYSAEKKAESAKNQTSSLRQENEKLKHSIGCLKYEVKKMKENQASSPAEERSVGDSSIPEDLVERLAAAERKAGDAQDEFQETKSIISEVQEATTSLRDENETLKHSIGCLKYEMKRLKEQQRVPAPSAAPIRERGVESPSIPSDLIDRLSIAEQNATEAKTNTSETLEQLESLQQENSKLMHYINCLKYEVKKLKYNQSAQASFTASASQDPVEEPASPSPSPSASPSHVPGDFLSRLSSAEQKAQEARSKVNGAHSRIISLEVQASDTKDDLKCLKYEVKKLKAKLAPFEESVVKAEGIPDDLLYRLVAVEQNASEAKSRVSELEKQERSAPPAASSEAASLPPDLLKRVSHAKNRSKSAKRDTRALREENEQLQHAINCLKYELKKLKANQTEAASSPAQPAPTNERDVETPALPSDLFGRLSAAEKKEESLKDEARALREENEQLKHSINCLKYELKKLKANQTEAAPSPAQITEREIEAPALPSDLLGRLSAAERSAEEAKSKVNDAVEQADEFRKLADKLSNELGCIKYEVKKLKGRQPQAGASSAEDNSDEAEAIPDDLVGRLSAAEQNAKSAKNEAGSLREENEKLKHAIGCLKYEVKKLKEKQTAAPSQVQIAERGVEAPEIPSDILDRLSMAEKKEETLKYETSTLYQENEKLKNSIGCLKYEMKKMKENQASAPAEERSVGDSSIPEDLVERLAAAERKAGDAQDEVNETKSIISEVQEATTSLRDENETLKHSIGCLKYEMKKLKERQTTTPTAAPIRERGVESPSIPSDLIDRLSIAEQNATEAKTNSSETLEQLESLQQENEKLKNSIGCLKYEVKKLKERQTAAPTPSSAPIRERGVESPSIPSDLIDRLSIAEQNATEAKTNSAETLEQLESLQQEKEKLMHYINCLKYEVKKLKEKQATPSPAPVAERGVDTPSIPSDLIDRLSEAEKKAEKVEKLKSELGCIKYEVKKLKERQTVPSTTQVQSQSVEEDHSETQELPSDLIDRLSMAEKKAESAKNEASSLRDENEKLKHSIGCLKYEMKKMKENQASAPAEERSVGDSSIPEDLVERLAAAERKAGGAQDEVNETKSIISELQEATTSLRDENETLKHSIGCLKYEMKKLKERQTAAPSPAPALVAEREIESPSIPSDLIDRLSDAEQNMNSLKNETSSLRDENEKLKHSIGCLKYEVKRLKEQQKASPTPAPIIECEIESPSQSAPGDLLARLSSAEKEAREAKSEAEGAHTRLSVLEEQALSAADDLKCLKYEVKKLKERPQPAGDRQTEAPPAPSDLLKRLSEVEEKAEETKFEAVSASLRIDDIEGQASALREESAQLKSDVRSLRSELASLKDGQAESDTDTDTERRAQTPAIPSDLINRLSAVEKKAEKAERLKSELRCIKYELKKLKERPTQTTTKTMRALNSSDEEDQSEAQAPSSSTAATERGAGALSLPSDLLSRLSAAEQDVRSLRSETSSLRQESRQLKHSVDCLKYEAKKLKAHPKAGAPPAPSDLLKRLSEVEEKAEETKFEAVSASLRIDDIEGQASALREESAQLKSDVRSLRSELASLKDGQAESESDTDTERLSSAPSLPSDLFDRLAAAEQNATEAKSRVKQAERDVKCLKYEVKKLKEKPPPPQSSSSSLDAASPALPPDLAELRSDLRCVKYEVKRLKERAPPADTEDRDSAILARISAAERDASEARSRASSADERASALREDLRCVKYEVKKLKLLDNGK